MKKLLLLLLATGLFVNAWSTSEWLEARADRHACALDFNVAVMQDTLELVPETDEALSPYVATLQVDKDELYSLAGAGDRAAFNAYFLGTVVPDVAAAKLEMLAERLKFNDYNVSFETRQELRERYQDDRDARNACWENSVLELGELKLVFFEEVLSNWTDKADDLEGKGVDVTGVREVIDGASSGVVEPLRDALDTGDVETVREAIGDYCLANGCSNGLNYHFFAKANLAKFNAIMDYLEADLGGEHGEEIQAIRAALDAAQQALDETGDAQYSGSQFEDVWDNIRLAAELIRDLITQGD